MIEGKKVGLPLETNPETSSEAKNQCKNSEILQPTVADMEENFSAVSVAEFETSEQKLQLYFDKFRIDLSKEIENSEPILSIGGKRIFTRGDISCIGGMAKSRKTSLIALFTSQFLENENNVKVIIFDTEQSQFYARNTPKRVHGLLEWDENHNNEQLLVFGLRELNVEERKDFIKKAITHYKPDLVFIDGIRDLVYDFNSPTESGKAVEKILALSKKENCHICAVLHANKNSEVLRGHLGAEMYNKGETTMLVVKKGNKSLVKPIFCKDNDFDEFYFTINERGLPEYCDPKTVSKSNNRLKAIFDDIFSTVATMRYSEMQRKIIEKGFSDKTAERDIKEATKESIIIKKTTGYFLSGTDNDCNIDDCDDD